jgi:hypothetical protein
MYIVLNDLWDYVADMHYSNYLVHWKYVSNDVDISVVNQH